MQAQYFQILFLHYFSERTDTNSQPSAMSSLEASRNRSDVLVLLDRCNSVNLLLEQKCLPHALHFSGKLLRRLGQMQFSPAMCLLVKKKKKVQSTKPRFVDGPSLETSKVRCFRDSKQSYICKSTLIYMHLHTCISYSHSTTFVYDLQSKYFTTANKWHQHH